MLDYLIEREFDELFRTSTRSVTFPDGETQRVEAYRLVWQWFDRALAYDHGPSEERILTLTQTLSETDDMPLGEALGTVLDALVTTYEAEGHDFTDDHLELLVAKQAMQRFYARKAGKSGKAS